MSLPLILTRLECLFLRLDTVLLLSSTFYTTVGTAIHGLIGIGNEDPVFLAILCLMHGACMEGMTHWDRIHLASSLFNANFHAKIENTHKCPLNLGRVSFRDHA